MLSQAALKGEATAKWFPAAKRARCTFIIQEGTVNVRVKAAAYAAAFLAAYPCGLVLPAGQPEVAHNAGKVVEGVLPVNARLSGYLPVVRIL